MSSQPPPPSPIYPRSTTHTTSPMTETHPQHQLGPFALPPPSYIGSPYNQSTRLPPPGGLAPLSIPPHFSAAAHHAGRAPPPTYSKSHNARAHDGRSAAPIERLLTDPPYPSPRSIASSSTQPPTGPISRPEYGPPYPTPPNAEQNIPSYNSRREPVASPQACNDQRGSWGPYRSSGPVPGPPPPHMTNAPLAVPDPPQKPSTDRYEILVRQQPLAARACGFGERDRRVIDPPPIVQLLVRDPMTGKRDTNELRYPFNVVHCTLWNEHGSLDETALSSQDHRVTRRLMGTLVASPFFGLDENDEEGCFFCFPDLSCRTHGRYRLRFVLMRIEVNNIENGGFSPIVTETVSDVFTVFTAKDFPGMRASTPLTKALKRQGCAISVKKGNEKANSRAREDDSGNDEADEAGERTKRRRRG